MTPRQACDCCNIRKIRCNGAQPCQRCINNKLSCTYLRQRQKSGPRRLRQSSKKIWDAQMSSAYISERSGVETHESQRDGFAADMLQSPPTRRIALSSVDAVFEIFRDNLYGIWPLLDTEDLLQQLIMDTSDVQTYTLSTALCAATLSHLDRTISQEQLQPAILLTADIFAQEAQRVRYTYDYMEPVTLATALTSYFLHIFYGKQLSRTQTAAFYIREAISFAQLLGMHTEEIYSRYSINDQRIMRKLYFLLFMTERYLCIQYGLPTILESSIALPTAETENVTLDASQEPLAASQSPISSSSRTPDDSVINGFLNLVNLFTCPGNDFFNKWTTRQSQAAVSSKQLLLLQRDLQSLPSEMPPEANNIQQVDIYATRHWIRALAWKLSVQSGFVASNGVNGRKEMSMLYPHQIAVDMLLEAGHIHPTVFEVHGPGMEVKMTEIASALADSIECQQVQGESQSLSFVIRPRDTLRSICDLIFSTKVMLPHLRESLRQRFQNIFGYGKLYTTVEDIDRGDDEFEGQSVLELFDNDSNEGHAISLTEHDAAALIAVSDPSTWLPMTLSSTSFTTFSSTPNDADLLNIPEIINEVYDPMGT